MIERVLAALSGTYFRFSDEETLQDGIESVLIDAAIPYEREFHLSGRDRLDFLVDGSIAIEVKIKGTTPELTRQLHRYAADPRVQAIIVVTSRMRLAMQPPVLQGTPLHIVSLAESQL